MNKWLLPLAAAIGMSDTAQIFLMELVNGQWSNPPPSFFSISDWYKNFTDISAGEDMRPTLSADGKFLFFTSNVSGVLNIHWVDSSLSNVSDLKKMIVNS